MSIYTWKVICLLSLLVSTFLHSTDHLPGHRTLSGTVAKYVHRKQKRTLLAGQATVATFHFTATRPEPPGGEPREAYAGFMGR